MPEKILASKKFFSPKENAWHELDKTFDHMRINLRDSTSRYIIIQSRYILGVAIYNKVDIYRLKLHLVLSILPAL